MKKLIAILILAFALQGTAQAQLGGLLNKAKEAVKKEAMDKSTDNATQGVSNPTLDAKASVSMASLSDEVRQAVEKLKDPSLRAPTCWAYDSFADRGGAAFNLEEENANPMALDKMNHFEFVQRIYRFSSEELDAIKKQIEDRNNDNLSICEAICIPGTFSIKSDVGKLFTDGEKFGAEQNLEKESKLYNHYINTLKSYVTQRYEVEKKGNDQFTLKSLQVGMNTIRNINGKQHFVIYDNNGNPVITPAKADIYDYERAQLIGIRRLLDRKGQSPDWDEFDFAIVVISSMAEGQRNSLANQEKLPVPASQMNNPALKAKMLKLARQAYSSWDIKELIIIESAWRVEKNALGQIIHRRINTNIILPNGSGGYTMRTLSFIEPYAGSDKYGEVEAHGIGTDDRAVNYKEK
jgi:hypothetical protein